MTFEPQYGLWSRDTLSNSTGATYDDPGEFEIRGGVTTLVPIDLNSGTYSFNMPWDHVTGWHVDNTMDSKALVREDFSIYTGKAYDDVGNIGTIYNSAFYTSGEGAAFVHNCGLAGIPENATVEFDVRSLWTDNSGDFNTTGDYAFYPSLSFVDMSNQKYALIEFRPDGVRLPMTSGASIPGDYSEALRTVRVIKSGEDISVMTQEGEHVLYVNDAFQDFGGSIPIGAVDYIAFGSWPWDNGASWSGSSTTYTFAEMDYSPNLSGFHGMALWDDIKINFEENVSIRLEDHVPVYPVGLKTLYTDAWYPSANLTNYQGAFVSIIGTTGGLTRINAQYLANQYGSGDATWKNENPSTYIFQDVSSYTQYVDLSTIESEGYPFQNGLRFKIQSISYGAQAPQIDTITTIGQADSNRGTIKPNWKMSALPKVHAVSPDRSYHDKYIPRPHPQDVYFLANRDGSGGVAASTSIPAESPGLEDGHVHWDATQVDGEPVGLIRVDDGVHGPAWRNFGWSGEYNATWESRNSYFHTPTGDGGTFNGELLDVYGIYPSGGLEGISTGSANVRYSVVDYEDVDGTVNKAQKVTIAGYSKANLDEPNYHLWAGIRMLDMAVPQKTVGIARQYGVIEGIIQIPRGPGVTVCLHENNAVSTFFLKGSEYRTPRKFGAATVYFKDHSSSVDATYASFGCLPRDVSESPLNWPEYIGWEDVISNESEDEFIIYSLTGYMTDFSWITYSGMEIDPRKERVNQGIFDGPSIVPVWPTGVDEVTAHALSGEYGTVEDLNVLFNDEGYAEEYFATRRNHLVYEGWFRPWGIRGADSAFQEVELASFTDEKTGLNGLHLYIRRDGSIRAEVDTETSKSSFGSPGYIPAGVITTSYLHSQGNKIAWGDWNHIGVCMESPAIGDGNIHSTYPAAPINPSAREVLHGARASKIYLTLNGRIVDEADDGMSTYTRFLYSTGDIAGIGGYPPDEVVIDTMPKLRRLSSRTGDYISTLCEYVFCDIDHVRASVRDRADVLTDIFTLGSKDTPGLLSHENAPKPFPPIASGVSHWESTHIYRFDEQLPKYRLLDDGFSPGHALLGGWDQYATGISELSHLHADAEYFTKFVDGPDGRPALRLGPGARVEIPWNSFDERIFNGSGSSDTNGLVYFTGKNDNQRHYAEIRGEAYERQTSNSSVRMGGWFRFNKFPTTGVMDLVTYDQWGEPELYGKHQLYIGVTTDGEVTYGSRILYLPSFGHGPFTGEEGALELDKWYHVGLDAECALKGLNANTWSYYFSGELQKSFSITCLSGGHTNEYVGPPFGYDGLQFETEIRSKFRIGGDLPRSGANYDWTYGYGDFDVQDVVIGYLLGTGQQETNASQRVEGDVSQWDWSYFASTGAKGGIDEVMAVNGNVVAYVSGGPHTGKAHYPATLYEDAGEQFVFFTANRGNDYEGLLQRGIALYPEGPFTNAPSYYVVYEDDNAREIIGSTDSPIQLGNVVPKEGINLALVNISTWDTEKSIVTFDMSDHDYNNITPKTIGATYVPLVPDGGGTWVRAERAVLSEEIRTSSTPIYSEDSAVSNVGYFMTQIGDDKKAVYIKSAYSHSGALADETLWYSNVKKVRNAISLRTPNGDIIQYGSFPYRLIVSEEFDGMSLQDRWFAVTLVAQKQTIGDSVFIHYPSIDYQNGNINLQDSEIYNPIPVMRRNPTPTEGYSDGEFSTMLGHSHKKYDLTVWGGLTGNLIDDNQSLL